ELSKGTTVLFGAIDKIRSLPFLSYIPVVIGKELDDTILPDQEEAKRQEDAQLEALAAQVEKLMKNPQVALLLANAQGAALLKDLGGLVKDAGALLEEVKKLTTVKVERDKKPFELIRVGAIQGYGNAAVLGGNVLVMHLSDAAKVVGLKDDQVNRIDIVLTPGAKLKEVRAAVAELVAGHGDVSTPGEHGQAMGNAMSGMQTGFSLCGLAALVVGLFLVYNTLAVCVAERRHEIGILLSLGATRRQIQVLFGGEALLLGLVGSLLGIPLGLGLANLM